MSIGVYLHVLLVPGGADHDRTPIAQKFGNLLPQEVPNPS
jgi:hypothetical protein